MVSGPLSHTVYPLALLLLPLGAFVVQMAVGRRLPRGGDWVSTGAMALATMLALLTAIDVLSHGDPHYRFETAFPWVSFGHVTLTMGILVDNLTAIMLLLVTAIALCVHFFSIFYMHGDKGYHRYFAFLSLFCFSMFGIVIADNLLMIFMFWELVGFSSYALIGFWFEKAAAAQAQKKAFVVNRVGDVGFLVGLMIIFMAVGDFRLSRIFEAAAGGAFDGTGTLFGLPLLTVAGMGLFIGAMGKSAQFPLHVWLPDAMEGPTTASSLIHAATMVAAGVFLTARIFPMLSAEALLFITYIGAVTAFMAATMALVQRDIKKVLAYSTVSQLGYMMLGLGSGGYTAGLSHLFTHAFFKCLLFLGAASVIHALHTQDMFKMGGIRKKMPVTFLAMLMGTLAIAGVPFFSGFVSKDAILTQVLYRSITDPGPLRFIPFFLGLTAAMMTAFYMFRLLFLTFFGAPRDRHRYETAHESPLLATIPLGILALFTFGFIWTGTLQIPMTSHSVALPLGVIKAGWLDHLVVPPELDASPPRTTHQQAPSDYGGHHDVTHDRAHHRVTVLSMIAATLGFLLAYAIYLKKAFAAAALVQRFRGVKGFLENLWYIDWFYNHVIVKGVDRWNRAVFWFDRRIIDGIVNGTACSGAWVGRLVGLFDRVVIDGLVNLMAVFSYALGHQFSRLQTGQIQGYVFIGMLVLSVYVWIAVL